MHHTEDIIEIPILPPENIHIQNPIPIISTSVMHYTEDITEPIGHNNANLEVNINEAVTKFLSLFNIFSLFFGV